MAKVFVIQETNRDYRKAEQFGELVFMSVDRSDDFHNVQNSGHNHRLLSHLRSILKEYDENEDWIIPLGGSPYVIGATFWLAGRMSVDKLRMLRWDNIHRDFIPLIIEC